MSRVSADAYFAILPEWVLYSDASDRAVRIYAVLRREADKKGSCKLTRAELGRRARCSTSTIDRALDDLRRIKAIIVIPQKDATTNEWSANEIKVLSTLPGGIPKNDETSVQERTKGVVVDDEEVSASVTNNKEERKTREKKRDEVWDALVAVVGFAPTTDTEKKNFGGVVAELKRAGATAASITARSFEYRQRFPGYDLTPRALVKHWSALGVPKEKAAPPARSPLRAVEDEERRPALGDL